MAYQQTDFAGDFCGEWRDGEMPKITKHIVIVSHDTRHKAYAVDDDQMDNFKEWVAAHWSGDNDPMYGVDFDGDLDEYLDEIDVSIRQA